MWLLTVFIVAVLGAAFLLFSKIKENGGGQRSFAGRFLAKGDPTVEKIGKWLLGLFQHHWERAFFLFLVHIPSGAEIFFRRLRKKAHDYYHGVNTRIRNKREFHESTVSPYMRSMSFRRDGDAGRV